MYNYSNNGVTMNTRYNHKLDKVHKDYASSVFTSDNYTYKVDAKANLYAYKGEIENYQGTLELKNTSYGLLITIELNNNFPPYINLIPHVSYDLETYLNYLKISTLNYFEIKHNLPTTITPSENIRGLIKDLNEQYFYNSKYPFNPQVPPTWIEHHRYHSTINGFNKNIKDNQQKIYLKLEVSYNGSIFVEYQSNHIKKQFQLPSQLSTTHNFILLLNALNKEMIRN